MKSSGPDSLNSWFIAGACCFINMMLFGMARLSGVLFVASTSRFQVSRQKASLPYTFGTFMRNASGPLVGYLGQKFGVRAVTTFGCILGAIGAGTCYFAEDIVTVTILWGVIFGLGFGMGNILLPVSINQYFDKNRSSASGLSFSGACIGSFILPPVVEILLNTYGLSGTYLFLAGFILNCVPAALLLKKPNFEMKKSKPSDIDNSEKQSIVSGMKVGLYTEEKNSLKPLSLLKTEKTALFTSTSNCNDINTCDPRIGEIKTNVVPDERVERLSTQTLVSEYSIHMSTSDSLNVNEIIENGKAERQIDPTILDAEELTLSSQNTDQNDDISSDKDEVFERVFRSSSLPYEKPVFSEISYDIRALSSESLVPEKVENLAKNLKEGYANYGYQVEIEDLKLDISPFVFPPKATQGEQDVESLSNEMYFNCNYEIDEEKYSVDQHKMSQNKEDNYSKSSDWSDIDTFKVRNGVISSVPEKEKDAGRNKKSCLGSFNIILDPTFITIAITNGLYNFTFVCMITVIVDYARDLNIGTSNEKYILMAFSIGDLIGHLGLGWITDCGYMTATSFAALCFACQGITTSTMVLSDGFITLMILATLYGLSEAGVIVIYPIIVAQYFGEEKQTVAIPTSNFLSGPVCLAVAPLIGYFRDDYGSYDYIFYIIGIISGICCLGLLLVPCIARCRRSS